MALPNGGLLVHNDLCIFFLEKEQVVEVDKPVAIEHRIDEVFGFIISFPLQKVVSSRAVIVIVSGSKGWSGGKHLGSGRLKVVIEGPYVSIGRKDSMGGLSIDLSHV